jgi:N-terminal domain of (some) glycogen debranching enzymes
MPSNDDLIILDGCTFFYSDRNGDVETTDADGLFYHDVRHVSRWLLRVNGHAVAPLTSRRVDHYSATVVGKPDDAADDAPPSAVRRQRATFRLTLAPRKSWSLWVDMTPIVDGRPRPPLLRCGAFHRHAAKMPMSLDEWLREAPYLETDKDALARTYRQSMLDLAALRIRPDGRSIRPDMFSGWGIRSLSSENGGYNPLMYHNGTVWPHDTAICAAGMRRYGRSIIPEPSSRRSGPPAHRCSRSGRCWDSTSRAGVSARVRGCR